MSLLVPRGERAADATEGGRSGLTAKGPRDLLLGLDHAQIPLGLLGSQRDGEVIQESQDLIGTPQQRLEQVLGRTLLAPPGLGPTCRAGGLGWQSHRPARRRTERPIHPALLVQGLDKQHGIYTRLSSPRKT